VDRITNSKGKHGKSKLKFEVHYIEETNVLTIGSHVAKWLKDLESHPDCQLILTHKVYMLLLKCYVQTFKAKYFIAPNQESVIDNKFMLRELPRFEKIYEHCRKCLARKRAKAIYWEHSVGFKVTQTPHRQRTVAFEEYKSFVTNHKNWYTNYWKRIMGNLYACDPIMFIEEIKEKMQKHSFFLKDGCDMYVDWLFNDIVDFETFLYILYPNIRFCIQAVKINDLVAEQERTLLEHRFEPDRTNAVAEYVKMVEKFIKIFIKIDSKYQSKRAEKTNREVDMICIIVKKHLRNLRYKLERCNNGFPPRWSNLDIRCELGREYQVSF